MILEEGDKVLVVHRRLFEDDSPRFFLGSVDGYEAGVATVTGQTWVREQFGGAYVRKKDRRTKIISLSSGTLIVYRMPSDGFDLETARMEQTAHGGLSLKDGGGFSMDLSESAEPGTHRMESKPKRS